MATDYTDPSTIDVDVVAAEINHAFKMRGKTWTNRLSWPNVTVKALVDVIAEKDAEIARLRSELDEQTSDHAAVLGRRGGAKGGKARAEALTPKQRSRIARKAALARWKKGQEE